MKQNTKQNFSPLILGLMLLLGCDAQEIDEGHFEETSYHVEILVNETSMGQTDIHSFDETDYQMVSANGATHKALSIAKLIQKTSNVPDESLDAYLEGYMCDYESKDGFRSSSKGDRCPIVSCSRAIHSYIHLQTHQLFYTDDQPMAKLGCYNVTNLSKILMYPADLEN